MSDAQIQELDAEQRDWLRSPASLTQRLKQRSDHFQVRLQSLQPLTLAQSAQRWLGLPAEVTERTVILEADDKPCIFAKSVWAGQQHPFASLGEQPLGERLFNDSRWQRGDILLTQINGKELGLAAQLLWARCSPFYHAQQWPVWVMEAFLPAVFSLSREQDEGKI